MSKKRKVGLHQLYSDSPDNAESELWGVKQSASRRKFIQKSALASMGFVLGADVVFGHFFPSGLIPAGLAQSEEPFSIPGKHSDLIILNDRPINAETPPHLLNDAITPVDKVFVRNNGIPPENVDVDQWTLTIEGESAKQTKTFSLKDLKTKFEAVSLQLTLECGGNGRAEFDPPAKGNQWGTGAVACPKWTGVRLKDVLNDVGIKDNAVYIGYYGADKHLSGDAKKTVISRGVPIAKAMEAESIIAWQMNGENLPALNGYPLRLVFGGWPASTSGKWLNKIVVRDQVHDGPKMGGQSYRVPCESVAPGSEVPDEEMCIIESMPVKSLITYPKSGGLLKGKKELSVNGQAWAGDLSVKKVEVSIDFGQTWQLAELSKAANRLAWQQWKTTINFPQKGYYEVWAKATDSSGKSQPMLVPGWNPRGYLNNACHRIAIKVV